MDHPALLPRDSAMRAANHAKVEWLRKAKEDTDNDDDDDDDDGDNDEVMEEEETIANDIEWDNLENKDTLIH